MLVVTFRPFTISRRIDEEGADHGHDGADQWAASEGGADHPDLSKRCLGDDIVRS
jgi:hypothetical protein